MNTDKIKVLQFTIAAGKGGRTLYVLNNWKNIDKSRFQFDFITFSQSLDFEQELIDEGCKVFHMSCYPEADRVQFIRELDEVLDNGYDVIHIHTSFWADTVVEERAKAKGIKKIIIHSHNTGHGKHNFTKEQQEEAMNLHNRVKNRLTEDIATDFWACSRAAAEWLYGEKIPKDKIRIMNNAIDTSKYAYNEKTRMEYRKLLDVENDYVYGLVGRLSYQKNQEFILRVFNRICAKHDKCKLLLVGIGEKELEYRAYVKENELEDKVIFLGFRNDVDAILQAIDCLCMPSRFEGFPISLVEAQTAGVKCVISDRITEEVVISDLVTRIPLDEDTWVSELSKFESGERERYLQEVVSAGYDIEQQILQLEKGYASFEN